MPTSHEINFSQIHKVTGLKPRDLNAIFIGTFVLLNAAASRATALEPHIKSSKAQRKGYTNFYLEGHGKSPYLLSVPNSFELVRKVILNAHNRVNTKGETAYLYFGKEIKLPKLLVQVTIHGLSLAYKPKSSDVIILNWNISAPDKLTRSLSHHQYRNSTISRGIKYAVDQLSLINGNDLHFVNKNRHK